MRKINDSRIKQLDPFDAAWLAGFVDGEGYLGIVYHESKKVDGSTKRGKLPWYSPRVQIAGTDHGIMNDIVYIVGGGTHSTTDHGNEWKPYRVYVLTGLADIKDLLIQLKPYIKLKKIQLDLLLEFVVNRINSADHGTNGNTTYSDRDIEIYSLLRDMNAKGRKSIPRQKEISDLIAVGEVSAEEVME